MWVKVLVFLSFFVLAAFLIKTVLPGGKNCKRKLWFLFTGAASFLSVFIVQMPLQSLISKTSAFNPIWKALLYALIAGFVQEFFKSVSAFYPEGDSISGFLTGTGFGLAEVSFILLSAPFVSLVLIVERVFALLFHSSSSGIILYFRERKKFIMGYVLISIVHTAVDFVAYLFHIGFVSVTFSEVFAGAVSVFVFAVFLFTVRKFTFRKKVSREVRA